MLYFAGKNRDFQQIQAQLGEEVKYFEDLKALNGQLFEELQEGAQPLLIDFELLDAPFKFLHRLYTLSELPILVLASREEMATLEAEALQFVQFFVHKPLHDNDIQMIQFHMRRLDARQTHEASQNRHIRQLLEQNRDLSLRLKASSTERYEFALLGPHPFWHRLEQEWKRAHRYTHALSLLGLSIPAESPEGLQQELFQRLQGMRSSDVAAQLSERFYVVLMPVTPEEGIESVAQHYLNFLSEHLPADAFQVLSTTTVPRQHNTASEFLAEFQARFSLTSA